MDLTEAYAAIQSNSRRARVYQLPGNEALNSISPVLRMNGGEKLTFGLLFGEENGNISSDFCDASR